MRHPRSLRLSALCGLAGIFACASAPDRHLVHPVEPSPPVEAEANRAHEQAAVPPTPAPPTRDAGVHHEQYIREHYDKVETRVAMRDGVELFTTIYSPKDRSKTYPILMQRTPYSVDPYGKDAYPERLGPSAEIMKSGYIFVYQDVRGCFMSQGEFVNVTPHRAVKRTKNDTDESTDTYDTVQWLVDNVPNNSGKVGQWGISYPGFYAAAGMINAHPALVAVSPQAPIADWFFDDFHHHGAFFLAHSFNFMAVFGRKRDGLTQNFADRFDHKTPDGYAFFSKMVPLSRANTEHFRHQIAFWDEMAAHPNYDDFWRARNILPHLNDVAPAVLTVGGWFDAEDLYGPLKIYKAIEEKNPKVVNTLVMGPWAHGGWARNDGDALGNVAFGSKTSEYYRANIEKAFFDRHLKGHPGPQGPEAQMFETGANRWRSFDQWPPAAVQKRSIWLGNGATLQLASEASNAQGFDEYISDPQKAVPFTEDIVTGMTKAYMTDDQRFASRRPDVLVYQTDVLNEDLTLAGPLLADLWVSTSGTASDWVVKVIDVFPDDSADPAAIAPGQHMGGYQMMVRSEVIRGQFRDGYERPLPFVPNKPTSVKVELLDVLHTFQKGHRMMVQIQSTWFPLVDLNPHTFVDNVFEAQPKHFTKATQRVYHSKRYPSRLEVGVLPSVASSDAK